jgi:hypothetical protein
VTFVLTVTDKMFITIFELILLSCVLAILTWFTISLITLQFKYSGSPYKTEMHKNKANYIRLIFILWSVAFMCKIVVGAVADKAFT